MCIDVIVYTYIFFYDDIYNNYINTFSKLS